MLLEVGSPLIDQVDLYAPGSQGQYFRETSGLVVPVQKRTFQYRRPVFPLTLPPGVSRTFYMRFQDHGSVPYSIRLWDPTAFTYRTDAEKYALGLYYGATLTKVLLDYGVSPFYFEEYGRLKDSAVIDLYHQSRYFIAGNEVTYDFTAWAPYNEVYYLGLRLNGNYAVLRFDRRQETWEFAFMGEKGEAF